MGLMNDKDAKILIVRSDDFKKIDNYHKKWYGVYKINLTKDMIKELELGNILLYNNDEYSFEIKKA